MKVLIVNGPNLDKLGIREPHVYGLKTLDDINKDLAEKASGLNVSLEFYQSNIEGELVSKISSTDANAIIINGGAYSHYSIAIRDALSMLNIPKIDVHISNIFSREDFRAADMLAAVCDGVITGLGSNVYSLALNAIVEKEKALSADNAQKN